MRKTPVGSLFAQEFSTRLRLYDLFIHALRKNLWPECFMLIWRCLFTSWVVLFKCCRYADFFLIMPSLVFCLFSYYAPLTSTPYLLVNYTSSDMLLFPRFLFSFYSSFCLSVHLFACLYYSRSFYLSVFVCSHQCLICHSGLCFSRFARIALICVQWNVARCQCFVETVDIVRVEAKIIARSLNMNPVEICLHTVFCGSVSLKRSCGCI